MKSSQRVFWKVRVWDERGSGSAWSKPFWWEMGLLSAQEWQAQWLNDGKANPGRDEDYNKEDPAPLFRKEFHVSGKVTRARLYICGLGYYEAGLNGKRICDHRLDQGWTRYSERVLYSTYDVTDQLRRGANRLGVTLGNGWYNPLPLRMWGHLNLREHLRVGRPRFIARLEVNLADGTQQSIASDASWRVGEGPIRFNSIYLGEIYDARLEVPGWDCPGFDDSKWRPPALAGEPIGRLRAQSQPPIRVTKRLKAVRLAEPKPGVFVLDFGQNFAGWVDLGMSAPAGTKVVLRYGELLNPDGLENGATTLWENWKGGDNTYSHNHPMFGSVSQWFYQWLGGIQPDPQAVGCDRIVIRPQLPGQLNWVRCHYNSVRGEIMSHWRRETKKLTLNLTIPVNTTATVCVPATDSAAVTESHKSAGQAAGVRFLRFENGAVVYKVGSGCYMFEVANQQLNGDPRKSMQKGTP